MSAKRLIVFTSLIFLASNAWAVTKTSDLYEWCTTFVNIHENPEKASGIEWYKAGQCDGFFTGLRDGEYLQYLVERVRSNTTTNGEQLSKEFNTSRGWCEPSEGLSLNQHVLMFNKYVNEHPESLHLDSYLTLLKAMQPHFPCTK